MNVTGAFGASMIANAEELPLNFDWVCAAVVDYEVAGNVLLWRIYLRVPLH